MVIKLVIAGVLSIILSQKVYSQLNGKVISENRQSVLFLNISLLKLPDSTLIAGTVTDQEGTFILNDVAPGAYVLRFSGIGYHDWISAEFVVASKSFMKDFGNITVQENVLQLGEMTIQGKKPLFEQSAEGMVLNVENSIMTKGSSVLSVLERAPGIVIDHRNSNISLNGKDGVMVMMNGKLLRMPLAQVVSILNSLSANDIEKIELLTTPPSKYDADGNAGLINIVTKKIKSRGTQGTISLTGGYGKGGKGTGSFSIAHNTSKIDTYGSYQSSKDRTYSDMFITSEQNMPVFGGKLSVSVFDTTKTIHKNQNVTLGAEARIARKTVLGGNLNFNSNNSFSSTHTNAAYLVLPDSLLDFTGKITGRNRWKNIISAVYLEKDIKQNEKINFHADYLYFGNNNPSTANTIFRNPDGSQAGENDSLFSPKQQGFAKTNIHVGVGKMDYQKQVNKKVVFETGLKLTTTKGASLSGIESLIDGNWVERTETANRIDMKEYIAASYFSFNSNISPKINLAAGLRYEYSKTQMSDTENSQNSVNRKFSGLFPNLSATKKLNENTELLLSYSKRISRPSYNDLSSFVRYSDPTAVYTGNPALKPTITHNLKLGYTHRNFTFSILFSKDINPIVRYQLTERTAGNLLYISPQNLQYQNNITFQATIPVKVNNWWTMNYGVVGGLRQFKVDHTRISVEKTYFGYSANFSQIIRLSKNYDLEVSGWYNSLSYNGSVRIDGFGMLNGGIKKQLSRNRGTLQLGIADILRMMQINTRYGTITEEAFAIKSHVKINTESRKIPIIRFTYSRSFGSGLKNKNGNMNGSNDERDRIRKD